MATAENISREFISMADIIGEAGDGLAESLAATVRTQMDSHFQKAQSPDGMPWAPLAPLTLKVKKTGGDKPLSGRRLRRDVDVATTRGGAGLEVKQRWNAPYASYHQDGAKWKRTGKQSWWMVINLFGYNPEKPWLFATDVTGSGKRGRRGQGSKKDRIRKAATWLGQKRARALWLSLVGNTQEIKRRPFAGFGNNEQDQLEEEVALWVERIMKKRAANG